MLIQCFILDTYCTKYHSRNDVKGSLAKKFPYLICRILSGSKVTRQAPKKLRSSKLLASEDAQVVPYIDYSPSFIYILLLENAPR